MINFSELNFNRHMIILSSDSYKHTHHLQIPENVKYSSSYVESRGGFKPDLIWFGVRAALHDLLSVPITAEDVEFSQIFIDEHIGPGIFNRECWDIIVNEFQGRLPVRITSVAEGTKIPTSVASLIITNTDPRFAWLPSFLEPILLSYTWYGSTVATISYNCRRVLKNHMKETSDNPDSVDYMLVDFGLRGTAPGAASLGGAAHILSSNCSDTIPGILYAIQVYKATGMPANSIIASEHMTMCTNSDPEKLDDYNAIEKMVSILEERVKITNQFQMVAAVCDTYNIYRAVGQYIGKDLKDRIMNSGGRFIVRPDSGDPTKIPVDVVEKLMETFGYTMVGKDKKYKLLPTCIRVLQGDGIDEKAIDQILTNAAQRGLSAENFVFGMGGALLQHCDRDWLKYAMKCSYVILDDGTIRGVFKQPITDLGKTSKRGQLVTVKTIKNQIVTKQLHEVVQSDQDMMVTVFDNFEIQYDNLLIFDEIRDNVRSH